MSELTVYAADSGQRLSHTRDAGEIAKRLQPIAVTFERWQANARLDDDASQDEVIDAYRESVDRLMKAHDFRSVDVVVMQPDNPSREMLREKFLHEHVHSEFEVRFFVDGQGLFCIHTDDKVYAVLCTRGDLISVPANTRHWFDMGPAPFFKAIRLFTTTDGWVAQYTADPIAQRFPRLGERQAA